MAGRFVVVARAVPGLAAAGSVAYGAWVWSRADGGWAGYIVGGVLVLADVVWSRLAAVPVDPSGEDE